MGAPSLTVELVRAQTEDELAALRRLYALYLHDLSEFSSHYELDEEARWQPDYLEDMLGWDECHCLLIVAEVRPVGFALVSLRPFPHMLSDVDARMAEFFVAQPYRRRGIGRVAALAALRAFPGDWVLEVLDGNDAALAFWRSVTGEATGGRYTEEQRPGDTVQRFTIVA